MYHMALSQRQEVLPAQTILPIDLGNYQPAHKVFPKTEINARMVRSLIDRPLTILMRSCLVIAENSIDQHAVQTLAS